MTAIIIDTETTGFDEPEVIELAYMGPLARPTETSEIGEMRFKPSKPIQLGAMAAHHIIDADLVNCRQWTGKWMPDPEVTYLVGHNVDFDWKAIGSPDIKRICTLALARDLWPNIDSHTLSAMMFHLYPHGMAREIVIGAHTAGADVSMCGRLLFAINDVLRPRDWAHLWELSEEARVPKRIDFGKFGPKDGKPGALISDIRRMDPGYVSWLLRDCDQVRDNPYLRKALTR